MWLTKTDLGQDLRAIRSSVPEDYVYQPPDPEDVTTCRYFEDDGKPSCLIGHILARHGVTKADVGHRNTGVTVSTLIDEGLIEVDTGEMHTILVGIQNWQDGGMQWHTIVKTILRTWAL
jgi:hypothetical protein